MQRGRVLRPEWIRHEMRQLVQDAIVDPDCPFKCSTYWLYRFYHQ